jgi:hypothetical protein
VLNLYRQLDLASWAFRKTCSTGQGRVEGTRPVRARHANTIRKLRLKRGASPKRKHEYQELNTEFKKEGRYQGREEDVASKIVNKQRAQQGETNKSSKKEKTKS